jgi:phosphohistidine phosphatase
MGAYLKDQGADLGTVLCSTARRTVETYENAARAFPGLAADLDRRLYDADAKQLLGIVRGLNEGSGTATVVGHNPAIAELALALAGSGEVEDLAAMADGFSPGSIARIDFDTDAWRAIAPGAGILSLFRRPQDLKGA